jgi:hypothetical protein
LKAPSRRKRLEHCCRLCGERVSIDDDFDVFLTAFLQDRNRFVHRLFTERGYNINELDDVPRIREFVDSLSHRSSIVLAAFHAFVEIWAEEHDLADGQQDAFESAPDLRRMIDGSRGCLGFNAVCARLRPSPIPALPG